eukprot:scaffold23396_cov76-Phaeocystis_antarctica.AAC.1
MSSVGASFPSRQRRRRREDGAAEECVCMGLGASPSSTSIASLGSSCAASQLAKRGSELSSQRHALASPLMLTVPTRRHFSQPSHMTHVS